MFPSIFIFCFILSSIRANDDLTQVVQISSGPIQGKLVEYQGVKVAEFLGIPFTKPPVGPLRLQLAEKPDPWTEVKSTVEFGASCPQRSLTAPPKVSEDCLFLNVWATQSTLNSSATRLRPVLIWIHGGSLTMGSGNEYYDGVPMVPLHDVVIVSFNYRLHALGFIYFGEGEPRIPANIGFKDQILALQWVQENIARFGGDPNQVTIFGESAGSMAVSAHLLSPLSRGLFRRAILQSGTIFNPMDDQDFYINNAYTVLNRTSCATSKDILGCLQGLDVDIIMNAQSDGILRFRWIYGDDFLPYTPAEAFEKGLYDDSVDLMVGVEKNEFSVFLTILSAEQFNPLLPAPIDLKTAVSYLSLAIGPEGLDYFRELYFGSSTDSDTLRSQLEKAFSDVTLVCPTYVFGLNFASEGPESGKVYGYYHTQKAASSPFAFCDVSSWMGTCHASDVHYVWGTPLMKDDFPPKDAALSLEVMKIWTHFAEFGKPPSVGGVEWKPLNEEKTAMILNVDDLGKVDHERIELCSQQWNNFAKFGNLQLVHLLGAA